MKEEQKKTYQRPMRCQMMLPGPFFVCLLHLLPITPLFCLPIISHCYIVILPYHSARLLMAVVLGAVVVHCYKDT